MTPPEIVSLLPPMAPRHRISTTHKIDSSRWVVHPISTIITATWFPPSDLYDAAGNRLTATTNGATTQNIYDSQNRLLTMGGSSYQYDNNGNLVSAFRSV